MSLFDKVGQGAKKGIDMAIRTSEKMMRIERLKLDIAEFKRKKTGLMKDLAGKVYEKYTQNMIQDQELVQICQEIKAQQWQIDERWTEINNLKNEKSSAGNV
jgi:hypothetical protein